MTATEPHQQTVCPHISDWQTGANVPKLTDRELHLWKWTLNEDAEARRADRRLLSPTEKQRANAFANDTQRADFIRNRAAKRRILGAYLGVAPESVDFGFGPKGKPYIAQAAGALQFNLTHSGTVSLLAVTRSGEIGVDLERVVERKYLTAIASRMFGDARSRHLESLPDTERLRMFYVYWTRIEACVKARGGSLFNPESRQEQGLNHVCFLPHPGYQACVASPERDFHRWHRCTLLYSNSGALFT